MSAKQSANTTHRKRLARRLAFATGIGYQQAHARVVAAAEAGLLPTPLDPSGMDAALILLASNPERPSQDTTSETAQGSVTVSALPVMWRVAHEGNPVPRCTTSSWRSGPGRNDPHGYGPGGYNRCVKAEGHAPEDPHHVDEWGNLFRLRVNGDSVSQRVLQQLSNDEMAQVARDAGMHVSDGSDMGQIDRLPKPNTLWVTADGEMVKVSTRYDDEQRLTAQVVLPVPLRTTVRSYLYETARGWRQPNDRQMRSYEEAWGL